MPVSNCPECGSVLGVDNKTYGRIACGSCQTELIVEDEVRDGYSRGKRIERAYPSLEHIDNKLSDWLTDNEYRYLWEASRCIGVGAYTAAEQSTLKTLEGVLRRIYGTDDTLGTLVNEMENDSNLSHLSGITGYFKNVRNRASHSGSVSDKNQANSTFTMIQRLLNEVSDIYPDP